MKSGFSSTDKMTELRRLNDQVNFLEYENARLKEALKEVRTFLEVAPFDFRNGNTHGPYDEGDVIGWEHHKKLLDKVKEACGE